MNNCETFCRLQIKAKHSVGIFRYDISIQFFSQVLDQTKDSTHTASAFEISVNVNFILYFLHFAMWRNFSIFSAAKSSLISIKGKVDIQSELTCFHRFLYHHFKIFQISSCQIHFWGTLDFVLQECECWY